MFHDLLKVANKRYINHARRLLQKTNQISVCLGSRRYCCKQDRGPRCKPSIKEVKSLQQKICISARKRPLQVCKPESLKPCLPCPRPKPDPCEKKPSNENVMHGAPDCPWADVEKCQDKKYKRIALLSVILAAAALGYIYFTQNQKPKPKKLLTRQFARPKPICKVPNTSTEFPNHVPYLLIGGGTASFAAFRAIKSTDPNAQVLVISNECKYPYMRPPLSKEMWFTDNEVSSHKLIFKQWNGTERSLFYEPEDFYTPVNNLDKNEHGGVSVALGWNVQKIDVVEKQVILEDGATISYDKCLIATGASPKNLDVFAESKPQIQNKITLFREIFDFQELTELCQTAKAVAIVGGGFLGSELACALGRKGKDTRMKVIQIYPEKGNMGKILPEYLSNWTTDKVKKEGVQVIPETNIEDVSLNEKDELILHLNSGQKVTADHVIVSVGVEPNTQLAEVSDLETDPELGGYLVNTEMEARSHLYAAGDCSCFYDTKLGRRRVEHHDHAVVSGRLAGENMAGAAKPYLHQSMFWSDLGPDVGYEAIGLVDSTLPTVGVFAKATGKDTPQAAMSETNETGTESKDKYDSSNEDFGKGVVFYLKDNTVVGIVLWNVFNRMSIARQVLKDQRKYDDLNEVAKLFNIHDNENSNGD